MFNNRRSGLYIGNRRNEYRNILYHEHTSCISVHVSALLTVRNLQQTVKAHPCFRERLMTYAEYTPSFSCLISTICKPATSNRN